MATPTPNNDAQVVPGPLWKRLVHRVWMPLEQAAVRAHMRELTWQPWGWVVGLVFDIPAVLVVYPDASPEWVLGLRLVGVPLQPLAVHVARRGDFSDEAALLAAFAYMVVAITLMALQGVVLGGLESPWVLGTLGFVFAGSLVADVRPARLFHSVAVWIAVWIAVLLGASHRVPAVASQLRSPRSLLVFAAHWALVLAVVGAAVHFGRRIASLRRELTLARRLAHYRLQARLGVGGMNEVWLAWSDVLQGNVALKILHRDASSELVRRFQREAAALRALRSENTVRILDFGASDDGVMFLAMEHLDGADLSEVVSAHGALSPARAVALLRQACSALAEAHAQGIVHRDVKPSNLFLVRDGSGGEQLKVLDFGIARRVAADVSSLTLDGDALGTPHFMPPEAFLGVTPDALVDVWGVGATLYFLLTARRPFEDYAGAILSATVMTAEIPAPSVFAPSVPADLDALVLRALARDRSARFPDIAALDAALAAVQDGLRADSAGQPRPDAPRASPSSEPTRPLRL